MYATHFHNIFVYVAAVDGLTEAKCITALKCLAYFLIAKPKKKDDKQSTYTAIPYLLLDVPVCNNIAYYTMYFKYNFYYQNSTPAAEYLDSRNNHPYIVRLFDGDQSVSSTYKIVVEQEVVTKCTDMTTAIYLAFSLHYIFNISYHIKLTDYFYFFQEVIFKMPTGRDKKSAPYTNFCAAIAATSKTLDSH